MTQRTYARRLKQLSYAERQRADGRFPAVLRFASLSPNDVAGMIAHAERRIGDVSHCDPSRAHLNRILVGSNDIAAEIRVLELEMKLENHTSNIKGTKKSRGRKAALAAMNAGSKNPWLENTKSGPPLREFVLTVHRDHFRADDDCPPEHVLEFLDDEGKLARFDLRKCHEFTDQALGFMQHEFGDMLKYCRVDFDEQSIHLQGFIYDIIEEPATARYATGRRLFRTTHHPLIGGEEIEIEGKTDDEGNPLTWRKKGYEIAQDAVGEWFQDPARAHMNIVRAEPRAAAIREAKQTGEEALKALVGDAFLDGSDDLIPPGSERARIMFALRLRISEEAEKKGGDPSKIRKQQASEIALDMLLQLGVVTHEQRDKAKTRRDMDAVLEPLKERYGTASVMVSAPDAVIAKAAADAAIRRAQLDEAAARRRAEEDQRAAEERECLDREAAERRQKAHQEKIRREKKFAAREAAMAAREENVASREAAMFEREDKVGAREVEIARKISWMNATLRELQTLGDAIRGAAEKMGLLEQPWVQKALAAGRRVHEIVVKKPPDLDNS